MEQCICRTCMTLKDISEYGIYRNDYRRVDCNLCYSNNRKLITKKRAKDKLELIKADPERFAKYQERVRRNRKRAEAKKGFDRNRSLRRHARQTFRNKNVDYSGFVIHHWNYAESVDVFFVTKELHALIHKNIKRIDGSNVFSCGDIVLDTFEKHFFYIKYIANKNMMTGEIKCHRHKHGEKVKGIVETLCIL